MDEVRPSGLSYEATLAGANAVSQTITRGKHAALVTEDESSVAKVLAQMLSDFGFEVEIAATVKTSLALARTKSFSVAFVDLALPDATGLELISTLRTIHPAMPIVVATGYGEMAARDIADDRLPPRVLNKPYDISVLVNMLAALGFSDHSSPDEAR